MDPPSPAPSSPSAASTASLYSSPPRIPPLTVPRNIILDPNSPTVLSLDRYLDHHHPSPASSASSPASSAPASDSIEVLSIHSLSPSPPPSPSPSPPPPLPLPPSRPRPRPRLSLLSRASQTFYSAFRKPTTTTTTSSSSVVPRAPPADTPLPTLLHTQLSALRAARAGFVDLSVLQPLSRRTHLTVSARAAVLLSSCVPLRPRAAALAAALVSVDLPDLPDKERLLVAAKLHAAQAAHDVERLKHQLVGVNRTLARPERRRQRRRRELAAQAVAIRDARLAVQLRLAHAQTALLKENAAFVRAQAEYSDIQGNWA